MPLKIGVSNEHNGGSVIIKCQIWGGAWGCGILWLRRKWRKGLISWLSWTRELEVGAQFNLKTFELIRGIFTVGILTCVHISTQCGMRIFSRKESEFTKHFQGLKTQVEQYELELDRQLARMDLKTPLFSRGVTHIHTISIVYMMFVMYKMISRPLIFHHSFRH